MANKWEHICIPVSPGELLDRLTIAMVRCAHVAEAPGQQAAKTRRDVLEATRTASLPDHPQTASLFQALLAINQRLWAIEDEIRQFRDSPAQQLQFVRLAHEIISTNDQRSALKRQIDDTYRVSGEVKFYR